uniref:Uncharacterized protein n=1 Tax=Sphaerodactylus townsendi TaxID=933632 RepID=A0ACB8FK83_9SAUR
MERRSGAEGWGGTMEEAADNTLVLSVIKHLDNFLAPSTGARQSSLNAQYQQMMEAEEKAEQIHSGTQLLQAEREKMQMELSHKKARIELEKQANLHARNYEWAGNKDMQISSQELEKKEMSEQLEAQRKQWKEACQQIQALQAKLNQMAGKEQRIQDLELKLSLQEQDAVVVRNMKADLARFPKMERELQQLREENTYLREMKENNGLLKEEVGWLQWKLERYEKVQADLVALELANEKLQGKLDAWEKLGESSGLSIK